jgi:hypothetical protein
MALSPTLLRPKATGGVTPFAITTADGDTLTTADGDTLRFIPLALPPLPTSVDSQSYGVGGTYVLFVGEESPVSPVTYEYFFNNAQEYPYQTTILYTPLGVYRYHVAAFSGDFEDQELQMRAVNASGTRGLTDPVVTIEI